MLASPGRGAFPFAIAGAPLDVVRGRVRWHVDADGGATRLRIVTHDPSTTAAHMPTWLGGGLALIGDAGVTIVDAAGSPHPLLRGAVTSPSIGAHELWLRAHGAGEGDWLRVEGSASGLSNKAVYVPPPIAAPILAAWSASPPHALVGRPLTTGPEFVSPKFAFAIVDLLGPIATADAGDTWRPLDPSPIAAALGPTGATRIVRTSNAVALANDQLLAPLSPTGQLGAPSSTIDLREPIPDVAAIRLESAILGGVPLDDGRVLVADAGRLATAMLDPLRVTTVARSNDLTHCELRAAPKITGAPDEEKAIAVAACTRHDEEANAGAQLVVGTIGEGPHGMQVVPERVSPLPTAFRFSATGAIVVAGACSSADAGGTDFTFASKVCVRDGAGKWRESVLAGVSSRIDVVPRIDGGLVVARTDASKNLELVSVPAAATMSTVPTRLRIDVEPSTVSRLLVSIDEVSPGRVVVWRRVGDALEGVTVSTDGGALKIVSRSPAMMIEDDVYGAFGTFADHAMLAAIEKDADGKRHVGALKVTRDAGVHWEKADWPESASALDMQPADRFECGPLGCRLFGWTRVGWQRVVASIDEVVDLSGAPELPPPALPPERATTLHARCIETAAPTPFDPAKVPVDHPVSPWGWQAIDKSALLGLPEPKMAPGFTLDMAALGRGAVRGAVLAWGPTNGSWESLGRMVVRFTTDLDPIGVAHESAPIASPFADRASFQRARMGSGFTAYALSARRVLLVDCELNRCARFWRVAVGQTPETIDLSSAGDIENVVNARELGDTLMIAGVTIRHEKAVADKAQRFPEPVPFVALVSPSGTVTTTFARAKGTGESGALATVDLARGRFGLAVSSSLPTWEGGSLYVLPIRSDATPGGAFEALGPAPTDVSKPEHACSSTSAGWDRGDTARTRAIEIETATGTTRIAGQGATIRERVSASGACLDRFTLLSSSSAVQLDPASGEAIWLAISADGKTATKHRYACTDLHWK